MPKKKECPLLFPAPEQRWLTTDECATYMRLSAQSVRNIIHSGELKVTRIGQSYRLDKQKIDQYMLRRERTIAPYRRGSGPWVAARWAKRRERGSR